MHGESEEQKIKQLFSDLKREDERRAPTFASELAAARSRGESAGPPHLVAMIAATAAIMLLGLSLVVYFQRLPKEPRQSAQLVITITQWKSPTAFLLEVPGNDLLKTVPQLNDAWSESSSSSQTKWE